MDNKEVEKKLKDYGIGFSHYQGEGISSWNFKSEGINIHTGDGGARLMLEAMEKELEKFPEALIPRIDLPDDWKYYSELSLETLTKAVKEFYDGKGHN